jgi:hypothetical protein
MIDPTDHNNANRYHLFKELMPDPHDMSVLDWGGNSGNLLRYSNGEISEPLYTSVDIDLERLEIGQSAHPSSKFIHYDRWSSAYNHAGNKEYDFPNIDKKQDLIYSFSIFTHTSYDEFIKTFEWLDTFDYKYMIHSMLDIQHTQRLEWFYNKRINDYGECIDFLSVAKDPSVYIMTVYDNNKIIINDTTTNLINSDNCLVFYDMEWLCFNLKARGHDITVKTPQPENHPFIIKST